MRQAQRAVQRADPDARDRVHGQLVRDVRLVDDGAEDVWREPLGAISPASLAAEGFASIREFRQHWMDREHRRFPPLRMTTVYRLRPWLADDARESADALLHRLYGDFLP
jgi:hypothetical protein